MLGTTATSRWATAAQATREDVWVAACTSHAAGLASDAELAAAYVVSRVRARAGGRWRQGLRRAHPPGSGATPSPSSPALRVIAEHALFGLPACVHDALLAWHAGERRLELGFEVPTPRAVLALQARGRRCVSLLEDDAAAAPHAEGLAFVVHDLCHAEKLFAAGSYVGQVGFFARAEGAFDHTGWRELERSLDAQWGSDRDAVACDMNGTPLFLFAALRKRLWLAVRRFVARQRGPAADDRQLASEEMDAWHAAQAVLLEAFALDSRERHAALALRGRATSDAAAVAPLAAAFERSGAARLAASA